MLQQKNFFLPSYACILCQGAQSESRDHLFFRCPFSLTCWRYICPQFVPHMNVHQNIQALKEHLMVPFHMEITTLVCWSIWKVRDDYIFKNIRPSLYRCNQIFKDELNLVFHRARRKKYSQFANWIANFR
ncbi:hypothetical protein BRADI_4g35116v3 [Brachypodium distachyon]|uniref:Reverse transcriptase zinc-binding domain-containing protein n=1 Tax=Brachypodium distachyon TaxID=15368 RepID=A0A2K2CSB3_BRADI|nr:hypothetical protein BRADI_4g35116v3 [Brachypodium distachyon]